MLQMSCVITTALHSVLLGSPVGCGKTYVQTGIEKPLGAVSRKDSRSEFLRYSEEVMVRDEPQRTNPLGQMEIL